MKGYHQIQFIWFCTIILLEKCHSLIDHFALLNEFIKKYNRKTNFYAEQQGNSFTDMEGVINDFQNQFLDAWTCRNCNPKQTNLKFL